MKILNTFGKLAAGPFICLIMMSSAFYALAQDAAVYVGAETCAQCHEEQYDRYKAYSKKAHSFNSVLRMASKLTPDELKECYGCHTTGYGQPGGFQSEQATPKLKNTGCEVCHGPGSPHADSEDPADLNQETSIKDCNKCHNPERVAAFNYKPLIFGGAH